MELSEPVEPVYPNANEGRTFRAAGIARNGHYTWLRMTAGAGNIQYVGPVYPNSMSKLFS